MNMPCCRRNLPQRQSHTHTQIQTPEHLPPPTAIINPRTTYKFVETRAVNEAHGAYVVRGAVVGDAGLGEDRVGPQVVLTVHALGVRVFRHTLDDIVEASDR